MPKRTNEFQQIILMIQKGLAGDSTVTESKMLKSKLTGSDVEVDIVIDAKIANVDMVVGVECTAKKRPVTVGWVREMKAKFDELPIDKYILVSKSGFSKDALASAQSCNMLPLTIEEATMANWTEMLDSLVLGTFVIKLIGYYLDYDKGGLNEESLEFDINPPLIMANNDSQVRLSDLVNSIHRSKKTCDYAINEKLKIKGNPDEFEFVMNTNMNVHTKVQAKKGVWVDLKGVLLKLKMKTAESPLSFTPAKFMDKDIGHGTTKNTFHNSGEPERDVVVTFLKDGDSSIVSVLVPKFEGGDDKIMVSNTIDYDGKKN